MNKTLTITSDNIAYSRETSYLGVIIDDTLSFSRNINNVYNKVSKSVGVTYRMSYYVPGYVLLNVYYSLIYSLLSYCITAWGWCGQFTHE